MGLFVEKNRFHHFCLRKWSLDLKILPLPMSFLSFLGWIFHWTNDYGRKGSPKTKSATLCSDHLLGLLLAWEDMVIQTAHFSAHSKKTSSQRLEVIFFPFFLAAKKHHIFRAWCFFRCSLSTEKIRARTTGRFGLLGNFLDGLLNLFRENSKFMDTNAANKFTGQLRLG